MLFKKPFKVKSHSQLSSSDRRSIKQRFWDKFSKLNQEEMDEIFPRKDLITVTKAVTWNNHPISIYSCRKVPLFFEYNNEYFPCVYTVWKHRNIVPTLTTNSFVVSKILNGADLMRPGLTNAPWENDSFDKNKPCAINATNNAACIAVGVTFTTSFEMMMVITGKSAVVYHIHGDYLCTAEDIPLLPLPLLEPKKVDIKNKTEFPSLCESSSPGTVNDNLEDEAVGVTQMENVNELEDEDKTELVRDCCKLVHPDYLLSDTKDKMDALLDHTLLAALKYSKTLEFPILASNLYRVQMMPWCPQDKTLDIKQSSFKRVTQFLRSWEEKKLLTISEAKKGIVIVEGFDKKHPDIQNFSLGHDLPVIEEKEGSSGTSVSEYFTINKRTLPLFEKFGYKKGDVLQKSDIRKYVTTYIKDHNLVDQSQPSHVKLSDPNVCSLCQGFEPLPWEDVMNSVIKAMSLCYTISSDDTQQVKTGKGKLAPISMHTENRSGNKKVTIVDNLITYNINLTNFAKECQRGVGASSTVSRFPGRKTDSVMVQGNQILFVHQLLTDKYKIPKKYITGLEFAPKKM